MFLSKLDILVRSAIKQILQIPHDTPSSLLYSSHKVKGLNLVRNECEAFVQKYNATLILLNCNCDAVKFCRDLKKESEECLTKLELSAEFKASLTKLPRKKQTKEIREHLRDKEYSSWCQLPTKGKGVEQFQEVPYCNKWMRTKSGLSSTEWTQAIKMVGNVVPVKCVPGRSQGSKRCRHCNEYETLAHILGKCERSALIRNNRHNQVREIIAKEFQKQGWNVTQEQICTSTTAGTQRFDILVSRGGTGYMLDPTIRFERNGDQAG